MTPLIVEVGAAAVAESGNWTAPASSLLFSPCTHGGRVTPLLLVYSPSLAGQLASRRPIGKRSCPPLFFYFFYFFFSIFSIPLVVVVLHPPYERQTELLCSLLLHAHVGAETVTESPLVSPLGGWRAVRTTLFYNEGDKVDARGISSTFF